MKKIIMICAAMVAAMTMNATVTEMTCAQAQTVALALADGATGTDSVRVIGYVNNAAGSISRGQQKFYMDDTKGSNAKTIQSYYGNLPADVVAADQPLNNGDKVSLTGLLMNYVDASGNHSAEIKNGAVVIIERVQMKVDTMKVDVCEALEDCSALKDQENSKDIYDIIAVVATTPTSNETYHTQTFNLACEEGTFAGQQLKVYNANIEGDYVALNDTVHVWGKLKKYGTDLEIEGKAEFVAKGTAVDTTEITVAKALEFGQKLDSAAYSKEVYKVTGFVTKIASAYNEQYKNMSFYMSDELSGQTYQFEAYRVKSEEAIVIGSKVSVAGMLKNYVKDGKSTIEIENSDVEVITAAMEIKGLNPAKIKFNNDSYFLVEADNSKGDDDAGAFYAVSIAIGHQLTQGDFFYTESDNYKNDATYVWYRPSAGILDKDQANTIGFAKGNYDGTDLTIESVLYSETKNQYFHFTMNTNPATGLEEIATEVMQGKKIIMNGQLYIIRDGAIFNAMGAQVK